jgi:hypothetical protein
VLLLLLVAPLLGLSNCGGPNLNFAAAFGWRGLVDTDVRFGEFFGSDHTLALRFMPQYPAAYTGPLIASDTDGPGSFFVGMGELVVASGEVGSDKIRLQLHVNGQNRYYTLGGLLAAGFWYHLAVVRSGNTYRLYVNGSRLDTDDCASPPCDLTVAGSGPSGTVRLGRLADGSTLSGHEAQFYGLIDDVAIFDRALGAGEIAPLVAQARLTGGEAGLLAGFTFDSSAPNGDPLPTTLLRPITFASPADLGVTYEGVGALLPAQRVPVSQTRDQANDAEFLPPPFQQVELRLPFPPGEAWEVNQGWETTGGSHKGRAAFAWDFIRAPNPAETRGSPIFAAAAGTVSETEDGHGCASGWPANYVAVDHAPEEVGVYLHFLAGSLQVAPTDGLALSDYLADTGDTGNTGCGSDHLHFALHNLPESQPGTLVTFPAAFGFYEASDDGGGSWYPVSRGVPRFGQWVRNPANGNSPPQVEIVAPANLSSVPYGGLNEATFEAVVTDAEDGAGCCTIRWSTYTDGQIGTGAQMGHVFATPGQRVVSATATDSGGAVGKATIILDVTNSAPTATIVTPSSGQSFFQDTPYVLQAQANDVNEPLADLCSGASWTSTASGDAVGVRPPGHVHHSGTSHPDLHHERQLRAGHQLRRGDHRGPRAHPGTAAGDDHRTDRGHPARCRHRSRAARQRHRPRREDPAGLPLERGRLLRQRAHHRHRRLLPRGARIRHRSQLDTVHARAVQLRRRQRHPAARRHRSRRRYRPRRDRGVRVLSGVLSLRSRGSLPFAVSTSGSPHRTPPPRAPSRRRRPPLERARGGACPRRSGGRSGSGSAPTPARRRPSRWPWSRRGRRTGTRRRPPSRPPGPA